MRAESPASITPPAYAARLGVHVTKVLKWIDTGELLAVNTATTRKGRPRWKITPEALAAFEQGRSSAPRPAATPPRRRRKPDPATRKFY